MSDYSKIPENTLLAIDGHVRTGQPCGYFVTSVLKNDLKESIGYADDKNAACLFDIVRYLYNECPASCWGSKEKVSEWIKRGGTEGVKHA